MIAAAATMAGLMRSVRPVGLPWRPMKLRLELEAQTSRLLIGFNRVSVMGEFLVPHVGRVRVVNVHFTNWKFERRIRSHFPI